MMSYEISKIIFDNVIELGITDGCGIEILSIIYCKERISNFDEKFIEEYFEIIDHPYIELAKRFYNDTNNTEIKLYLKMKFGF